MHAVRSQRRQRQQYHSQLRGPAEAYRCQEPVANTEDEDRADLIFDVYSERKLGIFKTAAHAQTQKGGRMRVSSLCH